MGASPAVLRSRTPGRPPNVVLIIRDQTRDLATSFIAIPDASMANLERLGAVGT